jgi:hypothetical protein
MKIEARSKLQFLRDNFARLPQQAHPLWHPLGFVSCVIDTIDDVSTTRIHLWPSGERRTKNPDWPIHTHRYHLSSLILSGRVRDRQYRIVDGKDYSIYEVEYFNYDSSIRENSRRASAVLIADEIYDAGQQYSVSAGIFHQSIVELDSTALTLVVQSEITQEAPIVLGKASGQTYPYDRVEYDGKAFWSTVEECLKTTW